VSGFKGRIREAWQYTREGGPHRDALLGALAPGESVAHCAKAVDGRLIGVTDRRLLVVGGVVSSRVTSYGFQQIASVSVTPRVVATKVAIELNMPGQNRDFFIVKPKDAGLQLGNYLASSVG